MEKDVTRNIEEQLSAFLDGELPDEELQLLVRRLEREESFRATLVRYSLLGNILRNDPVQASSEPFRARVMAAISSEGEADQDLQQESSSGFSWAVPLASTALVALVFVGITTTEMFDGPADLNSAGLAIAEQSESLAGARANAAQFGVTAAKQPRLDRKASINKERMTSYLVSHSERARPFQGPMADSRIFVQQASFEQ